MRTDSPLTRRSCLAALGGLALSSRLRSEPASFSVGVTDWNLKLDADPAALPKAKALGFPGVQISFGRKLIDNRMPVDDPGMIARYRKAAADIGITIDGTCVDRLHDNGLKSDPLAPRWVYDAIRLTQQLNVQVLLVPFFGRWALTDSSECKRVGDALRELAPDAEKANVILGLENTISAEANARILDQVQSNNVKVYYDVGNSHKAGFDMVREIRWLGKSRICQMHLKDNPHMLGQGDIRFEPIIRAMHDIGFTGWANLETDCNPASLDKEMRENLAFVRDLKSKVYA